ncbi:MAG: glycerophosphodiester phosphodiesterase family protein [Gammaproteobacteria bacterium]
MMNRLVAHRGDMKTYPENSLLALQQAAKLGLLYIELDIQLSKDLIPIVIHDDNTKRTTGIDASVKNLTAKELSSMSLSSFSGSSAQSLLNIPTLKETVDLLNDYSKINVFVEIKKESIEYFGLEVVVDQVLLAQEHAKFNIIIISFIDKVVEYVKKIQPFSTGYVLKKYNEKYFNKAETLQPDYLFCNVKKINKPAKLWKSNWKWVLYDITNPVFAYELLEEGVDFIETGDIVKLSNSEYFR